MSPTNGELTVSSPNTLKQNTICVPYIHAFTFNLKRNHLK